MHSKHALLLCVFAPALRLLAASPAPVYQDGILTKVRSTVVSNACSSSTQSDAATYGNTARRTFDVSARCSDIQGAIYTVKVGTKEYELTLDHSRAARMSAHLPLSGAFLRQSSPREPSARHGGRAAQRRRYLLRPPRQARIAVPPLQAALG